MKLIGEEGEMMERSVIEKYGLGSSKFHMGNETEITFVGQTLKRKSNSILGKI
jgi:hypothetical protein